MSPSAQSPNSASLPPLPDLQGATGTGGQGLGNQDAMAAIVNGLAPVKSDVDAIVAAAKRLVQSGAIPGAEQPCAQIVALATSLLPMAAQQALQPGQGVPSGPSAPMQALPGGVPPAPGGPPPTPGSPAQ